MRRRLYRFFASPLGRPLLVALAKAVWIPGLEPSHGGRAHPFLVVVTVDTETGYVGREERRVWQASAPDAFVGVTRGVQNLLAVLGRHSALGTFFLSTHCLSASGTDREDVLAVLRAASTAEHEIGLHLHPDSDRALQRKLGRRFEHTSAYYYSDETKELLIRGGIELIREHLGDAEARRVSSFRWGNWALDAGGVRALMRAGFATESSAVPGACGHLRSGAKYDWSRVSRHSPWRLSTRDHQDTEHADSSLVEIPVATYRFFGHTLRADPIYSVLLDAAFRRYHASADRSRAPFVFVVLTHSSEATEHDGSPTQALRDLDAFLSLASRYPDVRFITLREARKQIGAADPIFS